MYLLVTHADAGPRVLELTGLGWVVLGGLVLVLLRRVRPGTWLVLRHGGRVVAIHDRGLALVVPGWHQTVTVPRRAERVEGWVSAYTRDGLPVRLGYTGHARTVCPGTYARHSGPEAVTDEHIESVVAARVGQRDAAALMLPGGAELGQLDRLVTENTSEFGVEVTGLACIGLEAWPQVPEPAIHRTEGAGVVGGGAGMQIEPATVAGTGTLHHCRTRAGQAMGVLVEHDGDRRLFVYGSADFDVPAQTIVLAGDEADQLAGLLASRALPDRVTALEQRLQQLAEQPDRNA